MIKKTFSMLVAGVVTVTFFQPSVFSLTNDLRNLINSGIEWFDPEGGVCFSEIAAVETADSIGGFVDIYGQLAFEVGEASGIPYEAILGQAILESSYGKSKLTQAAANFHGLKAGRNWDGPVYTIETKEQEPDGTEYTVTADFRSFSSAAAGFWGYAEFIHLNPRYSEALKNPNDPRQYITEIKAAGYATDVDYVEKTMNVVDAVTAYIAENSLFPPSSAVAPPISVDVEAIMSYARGGEADQSCTTFGGGNLIETALSYAWHDYRGRGYYTMTAAYDKAIDAAISRGEYVGGVAERDRQGNIITTTQVPGVDCGGFVTRVIRDSNYDPNYNAGQCNVAKCQKPYLDNPSNGWVVVDINSTADLLPGDVAINNGATHTFLWVGDQPGFETPIASAAWSTSGNGRAPMAGYDNTNGVTWYRKAN